MAVVTLKNEKAEPLMTLPSLSFRNVALVFPASRHRVVVLIGSFVSFFSSQSCMLNRVPGGQNHASFPFGHPMIFTSHGWIAGPCRRREADRLIVKGDEDLGR